MKGYREILLLIGCFAVLPVNEAHALSRETEVLLELLQAKGVITGQDASEFKRAVELSMAEAIDVKGDAGGEHQHTVQSLAERLEKIEEAGEGPQKVRLSAAVEVQAGANRIKDAAGVRTNSSDLVLAKAWLAADADLNKHVGSRLVLQYQEGVDSDHVVVDEALISLSGNETCPAYLDAGKLYVPFGNYASHFISDPVTLTLGETRDTAAVLGWDNEVFGFSVTAYRGAAKEAGKSDHIDSYATSVTFTLPENRLPGFGLTGGVSWTSNLAASTTLQGMTVTPGEVSGYVGGISAWAGVTVADRFFLDLEYLGAASDFAVGDLDFITTVDQRPVAWNIEAAMAVSEKLEIALRYEGSNEFRDLADDLFPERQYGAVVSYALFDSASLAVEYLNGEMEGGMRRAMGTLQLAVAF